MLEPWKEVCLLDPSSRLKADDGIVTQAVQDYVLDYRQGNVLYAIHLIDLPGFDDDTLADDKVLLSIANFVNTTYKLKQTIAGVIYLHDITKQRMGGVGERNLRMLEKMIGIEKWDNCSLVTTNWGCTTNPEGEEKRKQTRTLGLCYRMLIKRRCSVLIPRAKAELWISSSRC